MRIGGPLAIRCDTCREPPGAGCVLLSGPDGRPIPWPRTRSHAARVKAAPPEVEVQAGDLVVVQIGAREALAIVGGGTQDAVALRFWSVEHGWAAGHGHLEAWRVLRLAPEDERTAAARAAERQTHRVALRPPEAFGLTTEEMVAQVDLADELLAEIIAEERAALERGTS